MFGYSPLPMPIDLPWIVIILVLAFFAALRLFAYVYDRRRRDQRLR
jgi:hypothetical protein